MAPAGVMADYRRAPEVRSRQGPALRGRTEWTATQWDLRMSQSVAHATLTRDAGTGEPPAGVRSEILLQEWTARP
jgi:hypothetical protein